jgi:Cu2+-containing amine oxidase
MTSAAGTTTTATSQYAIAVFVNGKQVASLTPADLAKLPQVKANIGGTDEQGPTFTAAITSIGVIDFTEVTVSGFTQGRVATADLTLKKSEITDNVMLAIVKRGTVKLTGTDIGAAKAIIDVNKITVK